MSSVRFLSIFCAGLLWTSAAGAQDRARGLREALDDRTLRVAIDLDLVALRRSAFADEVEGLYATALLAVEGSLANDDRPAITIERVRCAVLGAGPLTCHLFGRFEDASLAVLRAADGEATADTISAALPASFGLDSIARVRVRVCDAAHVVIAREAPDVEACSFARDAPWPHAVAQRFVSEYSAVVFGELAGGSFAELPGVRQVALGIAATDAFVMRAVLVCDTPELASRYREVMRARYAAVAPNAVEAASSTSSVAALTLRTAPTVVRDRVIEALPMLFTRLAAGESRETDSGPTTIAAAPRTLEPMAEIEAAQDRLAVRVRPRFTWRGAPGSTRMPIVLLGAEDYRIDTAIRDGLLEDGEATVHYLFPDGETPSGVRVWTQRAPEAMARIRRLLDEAGSPDPCATGCVLVAGGASAELAVELAALDPVRFSRVLVQGARTRDALPFLANVQALPTEVTFSLHPFEDWDETPAFEAALTRIGGRHARVTYSAEGSIAEEALAVGRLPSTPRPGRLSARPRGAASESERNSVACRAGDAAGCRALAEPMYAEGARLSDAERHRAIRSVERACALGDLAACFDAIGDWEDGAIEREAGFLYLCERGHGASCTNLGYDLEMGVGLAPSLDAAMEFYVRGCELGDPHACRNAMLVAPHELAGTPEETIATSYARTRAFVLRPEVRASVLSLCTPEGESCITGAEIDAFIAAHAPQGSTP